jgi:hypothetical protein
VEPAPRRASHRFLKTVGGVTHFAEVAMALLEQPSVPADQVCLGSGLSGVHKPWLDAAERGARRAVRGHARASQQIVVELVHGTVIDTRPDTVEVAAYCCAVTLLTGHEAPSPELSNGVWSVK